MDYNKNEDVKEARVDLITSITCTSKNRNEHDVSLHFLNAER